MHSPVGWMAAILLMAGCVDVQLQDDMGDEDDPGHEGSSDEKIQETVDSADLAANPAINMEFNGCQAMAATLNLPPRSVSHPASTTWSPTTLPFEQLYVNGFTCQKLAVGQFDRGPVSLAWLSFAGYVPPDACPAAPPGAQEAIGITMWMDDPEIAAHVGKVLGLDVQVGAVQLGLQGGVEAPADEGNLVVSVDGKPVVEVETVGPIEGSSRFERDLWTYWWPTHGDDLILSKVHIEYQLRGAYVSGGLGSVAVDAVSDPVNGTPLPVTGGTSQKMAGSAFVGPLPGGAGCT